MTPEQELLRNAYLAEMWPTCRELSLGERADKRERDRVMRFLTCPQTVPALSTSNPPSCPETAEQRAVESDGDCQTLGDNEKRPAVGAADRDPPTAYTEGGLRSERRPDV